ncbi:hypothetical protein AAFF_G00250750 [Aldrovandia affinis]|uniref:Uncharacterized protein n=1 Tax=Aldrovandia affinis TaxID=143900 RepID=A0AAD7W3B4_9TELE|nr:hypothetical protein AAFF_G00250750 [Aldrovandia affinis]
MGQPRGGAWSDTGPVRTPFSRHSTGYGSLVSILPPLLPDKEGLERREEEEEEEEEAVLESRCPSSRQERSSSR